MDEIFIDSSAFFALGDHASEKGPLIESLIREKQILLVTTNFVFAETISLVTKRIGKSKGVEIGDKLLDSGFVRLAYLDLEIQKEAWKIYKKYRDKDFDFVDAASFIFCQKQGIKEVITLDHHFSQMGFKVFP